MSRNAPSLRPSRVLDFLEALYLWDVSEEEWLGGLAAPLLAVLPRGLWVLSAAYDASDYTLRVRTLVPRGLNDAGMGRFNSYVSCFTPAVVARTFRATRIANVRTDPGMRAPGSDAIFEGLEQDTGARDVLAINGLEPSGRSACLMVGLEKPQPLSGHARETLHRMASHVASAARLREKLLGAANAPAALDGDAVFSPARGGRLLHAEAPAKAPENRELLTQALRAREMTRKEKGPRRETLEGWHPLVGTRWTLVDRYEENGSRYVVARENQAELPSLAALSPRERQVVGSLALGQSTKEVAYALGIETSTVRVLLNRAANKLGVQGRAELLMHPAVKILRGDMTAAELARAQNEKHG